MQRIGRLTADKFYDLVDPFYKDLSYFYRAVHDTILALSTQALSEKWTEDRLSQEIDKLFTVEPKPEEALIPPLTKTLEGVVEKAKYWKRKDGSLWWRNPKTNQIEPYKPQPAFKKPQEEQAPAEPKPEGQELTKVVGDKFWMMRWGELRETDQRALKAVEENEKKWATESYEQCIAVAADGKKMVWEVGDQSSVKFSAEQTKDMMGAEVLMHNHPSGVAFSAQDMIFGLKLGAKEMRVTGKFGTYSLKVSLKEKWSGEEDPEGTFKHLVQTVMGYYNDIDHKVDSSLRPIFTKAVNDGVMNNTEAWLSHHHIFWEKFSNDPQVKGFLNIAYSWNPNEEGKKAFHKPEQAGEAI